MELITWEQFLNGLLSPLIQAAVGSLWFFWWEYVPEVARALNLGTGLFDRIDQQPKLKRLLVGMLCIAVPVWAYIMKVLTLNTPFVLDSAIYGGEPGVGLWYAIQAGAIAFSASTLWHTTKLT